MDWLKKLLYKKYFLILLALLVNVAYFKVGLDTFGLSLTNLYKVDGDASDYVNSVENLIDGQGFTFFKTDEDLEFASNFNEKGYNKELYYAFRSPGFAFFYLPLRVVFGASYGPIAFLIFQIIITAFAKFSLAKIGQLITNKKWVFFTLFFLVNATPYFVQYNNLLLTESLGFSCLVFCLYFTTKFLISNSYKLPRGKTYLFYGGLFLTLAVMLRPFLAVFVLLIGASFFIRNVKNLRKAFAICVIYFSSFIVVDGVWIVRNYIKTGEFIPLASTMKFQDHKHKALLPMRSFSKIHGLSDRWFDKDSPVYWLITTSDLRSFLEVSPNSSPNEVRFFNELKRDFIKSLNLENPKEERQILESAIEQKIIEINQDYLEKNWVQAKVQAPFYAMISLLNQKNLKFFHHFKYPLNIVIVFWQSIILAMIFLGGVLSSVILLFYRNKTRARDPFILGSLFLVFFFGWLEQSIEFRELYTYSGIFLLSLFILLNELLKRRNKLFYVLITAFFAIIIGTGYVKMLEEINW